MYHMCVLVICVKSDASYPMIVCAAAEWKFIISIIKTNKSVVIV